MSSSVRIFNSLSHLLNKNTSAFKYNYADKILLKKTIVNNSQYIESWQSKCLFNYYFQEFSNYNKIFTLDLKINNDILKIKYLSINNDYYDKTLDINYNYKLTDEETRQIKKENNIKKIIINLER